MLIFRQLFDSQSSTYTYLLGDSLSGEAILIDPVFDQVRRDTALIHELGLHLIATLETHIHADHVTGAWLLKQRTGSKIGLSAKSGATGADYSFNHGETIQFGQRHIQIRETPGHTNGCLTYVLDDQSQAFTGDCLLIRGSGRTDFQQGDSHAMYRSVHDQIFTLPAACLLFPAHDYRGVTVTTVEEEQTFNPRLGGDISIEDFAGYVKNLDLPHPKKIDIAVPANLKCGQTLATQAGMEDPTWANLIFTFAGIWEIPPQSLEEVTGKVQIIDVRESSEYLGAIGHIHDAQLIPLGQLRQRVEEISHDKPVVTVCHSGARSAQAVVILQQEGFQNVANLSGGMLRWRAEGYVVAGGSV